MIRLECWTVNDAVEAARQFWPDIGEPDIYTVPKACVALEVPVYDDDPVTADLFKSWTTELGDKPAKFRMARIPVDKKADGFTLGHDEELNILAVRFD